MTAEREVELAVNRLLRDANRRFDDASWRLAHPGEEPPSPVAQAAAILGARVREASAIVKAFLAEFSAEFNKEFGDDDE